MTVITKPGTLISDTIIEFYNASIRPWGIIIPKNSFISFFTQEKGNWPAGQAHTPELAHIYGKGMPILPGTNLIASSDEFISDKDYIGVKWFGKIYSTVLYRKIGFEVIKSSFSRRYHSYDISHLDSAILQRMFISEYMQDNYKKIPYDSITSDMLIMQQYIGKVYKGLDELSISVKENKDVSDLVTVLRTCYPE